MYNNIITNTCRTLDADKLKYLIVATVALAMLITISVGVVVRVLQYCGPSLKSVELLVTDKPGSLIAPLKVFRVSTVAMMYYLIFIEKCNYRVRISIYLAWTLFFQNKKMTIKI